MCAKSSSLLDGSRLEWPNLVTSSQFISHNAWEHKLIPAECMMYPKDMVVPEQLQQILMWSLMPGSSWSQPPVTSTPKKPSPSNDENHDTLPETSDTTMPVTNSSTKSIASLDTTSSSSYKSSTSHLPLDDRGCSAESDKSLRSKIFAKLKLGKSDEKVAVTVEKKAPAIAECTSCFEEFPERQMTCLKSCRHWYCKECFGALITTAIAAEVTFPPKCCLSPIPLQQILKALDTTQRERYQAKASEYAVPMVDRWYCPNTSCLKWISGTKLKINRELGYDCPYCSTKLCRTCRGPAHEANTECPQDFGLEATLETAEIEGWQRCYSCRALVEHNTGCRHMTCRCRAEFCYVCSLRWQTCACTEADAARKRASVDQRRQARMTQLDTEAAEIAQAIAEIEEMERREEEERQQEEARREREEAEQLLQLEAERLAEEERKREEAIRAEREFRLALKESFEEEWKVVEQLYYKIVAFQYASMNSRHETDDSALEQVCATAEEAAKHEFDINSEKLGNHHVRRRNKLMETHKADVEEMNLRQEEEEDDLFLQVQMRLRGKANKESRMERLLAEIHKQQEEQCKELENKQAADREELENRIRYDCVGVQQWYELKMQDAKIEQAIAAQKLGYTVGTDRRYFELVTDRRNKLLAKHSQSIITSIEEGEEPTGLTEYEASQIQPSLPEFTDGYPGPSSEPHGLVSATASSQPSQRAGRFYEQNHSLVDSSSPQQRKPNSTIHTETEGDLYSGQRTPTQQPISRAPTPSSIQLDTPISISRSKPAPALASSAPTSRPPCVPPSLPQPPSNNNTTPNPPPLRRFQHTQRQTATQAMAVASIAAGMALSAAPHQVTKQSITATVVSAPVSSSQATKKKRWGFTKGKEMTEEEMKRRLRATVGDAF